LLEWNTLKNVRQSKSEQRSRRIDGESLDGFEADLKDNLYKVWNRVSSSSYFPPTVKVVEMLKKDGGRNVTHALPCFQGGAYFMVTENPAAQNVRATIYKILETANPECENHIIRWDGSLFYALIHHA
jgi:hypothetical protein